MMQPSVGRRLCSYDADANRILLPEHIRAWPAKKRRDWMKEHGIVPAIEGGAYSMFEMMQSFMGADFAAVTAAAKTALTPDTLFTLPANVFAFPGKALWFHAVGVLSNVVTTPGTYTFSLNWGGSAGTVLATTGAIAPSPVVNTNTLWFADFYIKARAIGALTTSLTLTTYGVVESPSWLVATTQAIAGVNYAPPNTATPGTALADVTGLDQTVAKALTLAVTPTVTTGSIACRDAWVVALN